MRDRRRRKQWGIQWAEQQPPPPDVLFLIPRTCAYVTLYDKRDFAAIKLRAFRWKDYPGLTRQAQCNPGILTSGEPFSAVARGRWDYRRKVRSTTLVSLKRQEEAQAKAGRWPPGTRKGEEVGSPLQPPNGGLISTRDTHLTWPSELWDSTFLLFWFSWFWSFFGRRGEAGSSCT